MKFLLSALAGLGCKVAGQRIGVVGGGVGGASTLYHLKKIFNTTLHVDVFEKNAVLGGRVSSRGVDNGHYLVEEGAGVVHQSNRIFLEFADSLNLTFSPPGTEDVGPASSITVAMFNGTSILWSLGEQPTLLLADAALTAAGRTIAWLGRVVAWTVKHSPSPLRALARKVGLLTFAERYPLVARYGPRVWFSVPKLLRGVMTKWFEVYEIRHHHPEVQGDDKGEHLEPFASLREFMTYLKLDGLLAETGRQFLSQGVANRDLFLDELLPAFNRINYGQGRDINAFVSSVSLAGVALVGDILAVEGGNWQVPDGIIRKHADKTLTSRRVVDISKTQGVSCPEDACLSVLHVDAATEEDAQIGYYNAVVIATPVELANLTLEGRPATEVVGWDAQPYHRTISTWVISSGLRRHYFDSAAGEENEVYGAKMIMTSSPDLPFNSIGLQLRVKENLFLYKVFSREILSEEQLHQIFVAPVHWESKEWRAAYPEYDLASSPLNASTWPQFELDGQSGIFYVNAIESAASAIEVMCVGGRNVAELLAARIDEAKKRGAAENVEEDNFLVYEEV